MEERPSGGEQSADEETEVTITFNDKDYIFNLVEKKGTNTRTGNKVPLRAPMVR